MQHRRIIIIIAEGMSTGSAMKQHLIRIERIAAELNVWLLVIAIGLGMLDLTVLVAKCIPALPKTPAAVSADSPANAGVQTPSAQNPSRS